MGVAYVWKRLGLVNGRKHELGRWSRLAEADPAFFDLIKQWLATTDVATRHEMLRGTVACALAPIGVDDA